jgi:cob(I)alamin adenosyltransferase
MGAPPDVENDAMLGRIQNDLFDLGADLCTPEESERAARRSNRHGGALRIIAAQVARLEGEIDRMNAGLRPLDSFILPGGTPAAAYLHLARTIVRRAERLVCALAAEERVNPEAVKYLNRLSDHLFVLGRRLNDNGAKDVLWQPGLTR